MKIGVRKSPHLEKVVAGIQACGDRIVSEYDGGSDWFLAWGWPQAQQVMRDNRCPADKIICVDAHPFALFPGDESGARIFQLGSFGALAKYPPAEPVSWVPVRPLRHNPSGPVLVVGQVYTRMQNESGLVDVWHTPGFEAWAAEQMSRPNRKFRPHPRMVRWEGAEPAPTLEQDLEGTAGVVTWNSTVGIHAQMLGYPQVEPPAEAHGWGHLSIDYLAGLVALPRQIQTGEYWGQYRAWLSQAAT